MIPDDSWDPDSPAGGDGLYGLPHTPDEAAVRVIPVPFDATVSFGSGTSAAPEAVRMASWQVDLDGGPWRQGVAMEPVDPRIAAWNQEAGDAVGRCRAGEDAYEVVDRVGMRLNALVGRRVTAALDAGQIPAVLGGDHSVPVGAVVAAAQATPGLGVLHIDAHADLRPAYEGFAWSHASAIGNMLVEELGPVVSVGLRDVSSVERSVYAADDRLHWWSDQDLANLGWSGEPWPTTCARMLEPLPEEIWITWDIDGLDPTLCPGTGTPVPGGLSWQQALGLIDAVSASGRRVVGFDVVEVGGEPWDANVGARLLWALAGCAVASR